MIRLILNRQEPGDDEGNNRYTRARGSLIQGRDEQKLRETARPSYWAYEQEFDIPEIGRKKVKGFIGLVRLQDCSERRILPHEKIMTQPLEDRVRLMAATGTQFEYIWGLYQDKAYVIDNILDVAERGQPILDHFEQETLVKHRLWRLVDPAECGIVSRTTKRLTIYIADGHHRCQAMLTVRDRMRARRRWLRDLRDREPGVHKFGALISKMNRYFLITLRDMKNS